MRHVRDSSPGDWDMYLLKRTAECNDGTTVGTEGEHMSDANVRQYPLVFQEHRREIITELYITDKRRQLQMDPLSFAASFFFLEID